MGIKISKNHFMKLGCAVFLFAHSSFLYAQEPIYSFDFSVENDLIRLKDFQEMRQGVFTQGIDSLNNIIPTEAEIQAIQQQEMQEISATETATVTETEPSDPMANYVPTLKERRIAAHEKWRTMTEEDKKEFFQDVTDEDERKLQERIDFLKTRLELTPTRGKIEPHKN